jgi:serine/threonine-protein kinase
VVGLGVGTFFGVKAIGKNSDAEKRCAGASCDQGGLDLTKEAKDAALISNIAFGAGAALVAAGVVLYVMAPGGGEAVALSPAFAPGGGGLSLSGAF